MSTILLKVGEVNCQPFFEGCYDLKHELIYIFKNPQLVVYFYRVLETSLEKTTTKILRMLLL